MSVRPFDKEKLHALLARHWGLQGKLSRLNSYSDLNFRLTCPDGAQYVFKINSPAEKKPALAAQNRAMCHLSKIMPDGAVPQVLETKTGDEMIAIEAADGRNWQARVLTWLEGRFVADTDQLSLHQLRALGGFLAGIDRGLSELERHGAEREMTWDLRNTDQLASLVQFIQDPSDRRRVDYFVMQFESSVRPQLHGLRKSLIHNDANEFNLLVREPGAASEFGLIDFGDLVYSNLVCEPAVALAYLLMYQDNALESASAFLSGYNAVLPLAGEELQVLYYLVASRLCISLCMSSKLSRETPENTYISASQKPAFALLKRWHQINPHAALERFKQACNIKSISRDTSARQQLREKRDQYIGRSLSLSYSQPLKIVQGSLQYLYEQDGRTLLDAVNNVPHVGHNHPHVVRAIQRQAAMLNTNTRYLHDTLIEYAQRLTQTLPEPLRICYFVNSGSEANDLAIRLARAYTGRRDMIVLDAAYHGHTISAISLSPYKFNRAGGSGPEPHIHIAALPDTYRGPHRDPATAGNAYAREVAELAEAYPVAGFICESLPGCGGQIVLPQGYLKNAFQAVRARGGVCIADEVQVGFGRVGEAFWGFELQDAVPDIVTLGKPIGNGHPLAAVITTPQIAAAFTNGMEYFNTFGGNPVSCAAGMAVLDVIESEHLQQHAADVGGYLKQRLTDMQPRFACIGDVRGAGLYIGAEIVTDPDVRTPDAELASKIVNQMMQRGVLISTDGPDNNVLKIKPPLVFDRSNAAFLVEQLHTVLKALRRG